MGTTSIIRTALVCVLALGVMYGCVSGSKPLTDEEMVMLQLETLRAAVLAHDVDKGMVIISEEFYQPVIGDKDAMRSIIQMGIDNGYLDDTAEGDFSLTEVAVEEDTATASPVLGSCSMGSISVEVNFKKENGQWLIVGGDEVF